MTKYRPSFRFWLPIVVLSLGCSDAPTAKAVEFELAPIESFESKWWTGATDPDDPVVATVEGTPITLSMLKRQLERSPKNIQPQVMLERMIEMELLARAAFKSGKYTTDIVGDAVRKALAHRWIKIEMDEQLSPKAIEDKYLAIAYEKFKARYDHFDRFIVADVQVLCCTDVNLDGCFSSEFDTPRERREALTACLDNHQADAQAVHDALAGATSLEDFKNAFASVIDVFPSQALRHQYNTEYKRHEYGFQYDLHRSYEVQFHKKEYRQLYKEVMNGVRDAYLAADERRPPFMTPPIRSPIGWHIIFVHEVHPEKHWKLENPYVQQELREASYNRWRQVHFQKQLSKLCESAGCDSTLLAVEEVKKRLQPLQDLDDGKRN